MSAASRGIVKFSSRPLVFKMYRKISAKISACRVSFSL